MTETEIKDALTFNAHKQQDLQMIIINSFMPDDIQERAITALAKLRVVESELENKLRQFEIDRRVEKLEKIERELGLND